MFYIVLAFIMASVMFGAVNKMFRIYYFGFGKIALLFSFFFVMSFVILMQIFGS
ncbi:hypothetical protein [Anoxynatronum sibiricum]|uniref:NADH dehydrogenase subunit 5 n=1 Tax=Anoxynatronum sibiricum TaxID=210623 RepID=A0ABU9VZF3_9CLOT